MELVCFWSIYGVYTFIETIFDIIFDQLPFFCLLKIVIVLSFVSPITSGYQVVFARFLRPMLEKREHFIETQTNTFLKHIKSEIRNFVSSAIYSHLENKELFDEKSEPKKENETEENKSIAIAKKTRRWSIDSISTAHDEDENWNHELNQRDLSKQNQLNYFHKSYQNIYFDKNYLNDKYETYNFKYRYDHQNYLEPKNNSWSSRNKLDDSRSDKNFTNYYGGGENMRDSEDRSDYQSFNRGRSHLEPDSYRRRWKSTNYSLASKTTDQSQSWKQRNRSYLPLHDDRFEVAIMNIIQIFWIGFSKLRIPLSLNPTLKFITSYITPKSLRPPHTPQKMTFMTIVRCYRI